MSNPPAGQRSRKRYQDRRQEIADIAARVFAQQGYHGASIADLVAATGLQRGGLYYYIEGKKELLVLIHERFMEPLLRETYEILAMSKPPDITLRMLIHVLLDVGRRYRDQITVFLREWRNARDDSAWEQIIKVRKEYESILLQVLKQGADEGVFIISDYKMTLMSLLGMVNYTHQWFDPDGRVGSDELADLMSDIFLHGVQTDPYPSRTASYPNDGTANQA